MIEVTNIRQVRIRFDLKTSAPGFTSACIFTRDDEDTYTIHDGRDHYTIFKREDMADLIDALHRAVAAVEDWNAS